MSKHLDIVWTNQFKKYYKLAMKRHLNIDLLDDIIKMSGKTSDLNPGMTANTLFSRCIFLHIVQ